MNSRFPKWIRVKAPKKDSIDKINSLMKELSLNTVCEEANCPNKGICYKNNVATFLILGRNCTRNCSYCNVNHSEPDPVDYDEPGKVAKAVSILGLKHVVITSVTRDDIRDGGAHAFSETVKAIRNSCMNVTVEVLIPDFNGDIEPLNTVVCSKPEIIGHNIEIVPSLYKKIRPKAIYERSIELLERIKKMECSIYSKSGLIVGLGETYNEVTDVIRDLKNADCDILTIGQYLRPSERHIPVAEYIKPELFNEYAGFAKTIGFKYVYSAPLVRSSYNAGDVLGKLLFNP